MLRFGIRFEIANVEQAQKVFAMTGPKSLLRRGLMPLDDPRLGASMQG
jgi:hypothetical protein